MKNRFWAVIIMAVFMAACSSTQTLSENGRRFEFKKDGKIVIGKTAKRDIFDLYGQPSRGVVRGKYEILAYTYSKETLKPAGVGNALLGAVPVVGLVESGVELQRDRGKDKNIHREWQDLEFYVELSTGIVRDYYYHDSALHGNDESETLYLKSIAAFSQKKNGEAVKMLERAVSLDPNNHRAANMLAWHLIDLNIDVNKGTTYAEEAVRAFPDSPYSNGTLGVGYYKKGDMSDAEKYLQTAVDLFPIYAPNDVRSLQYDTAMLKTVRDEKKHQK
jgi:tetratricopeptide (TPR) repeat protein